MCTSALPSHHHQAALELLQRAPLRAWRPKPAPQHSGASFVPAALGHAHRPNAAGAKPNPLPSLPTASQSLQQLQPPFRRSVKNREPHMHERQDVHASAFLSGVLRILPGHNPHPPWTRPPEPPPESQDPRRREPSTQYLSQMAWQNQLAALPKQSLLPIASHPAAAFPLYFERVPLQMDPGWLGLSKQHLGHRGTCPRAKKLQRAPG
mmetsp:Transcript_68953/g.152056  ORF Transcript_68953/g.152056 Transcript_68953/m.152056 type:complete len:208 (+) Transcript_68953:679-1302(+)